MWARPCTAQASSAHREGLPRSCVLSAEVQLCCAPWLHREGSAQAWSKSRVFPLPRPALQWLFHSLLQSSVPVSQHPLCFPCFAFVTAEKPEPESLLVARGHRAWCSSHCTRICGLLGEPGFLFLGAKMHNLASQSPLLCASGEGWLVAPTTPVTHPAVPTRQDLALLELGGPIGDIQVGVRVPGQLSCGPLGKRVPWTDSPTGAGLRAGPLCPRWGAVLQGIRPLWGQDCKGKCSARARRSQQKSLSVSLRYVCLFV